jgi:flagellin-like hook-associated protein FlgL
MLSSSYQMTSEVRRQQALQQQIAQLQTDISSGVKVHVASDDPTAASRISTIGTQQSNEAVYTTNVSMAQAINSQLDTNLAGVQTSLTQANELMLRAANGTMNDTDRAAIVTQLQGIQQDIATAMKATDSSGNPLYYSGSAAPLIPVGKGVNLAAADSADQVFGSVTLKSVSTTPPTTSSINDILTAAITALQNNDSTAISASITDVQAGLDHITAAQADIGVRGARFNSLSDALATSKTDLAIERSGLEDTDATEAYATLSNKMTVLTAAQTVLAQLGKISLFDKIG